MGAIWTPEEDALLRELYPKMGNAEASRLFAESGFDRSPGSLCSRAKKLGVGKDESAGYRKPMPRRFWTEEMDAWFVAFVPGHTEPEISAECERVFGFPLNEGQIGNAKFRLGVKSGTHGGQFKKGSIPPNKGKTWDEMGYTPELRERMRATQFKKGGVPHNAYHRLLDEKTDEYGEWVYVRPRNATKSVDFWISKQRFVWMQANGRDWPEGCRAVFADHDNTNYDPENIVPVPKDIYPIVQGAVRNQMEWHDRETLELAIVSARVTQARARLVKRMREKKRCTH